MEKILSKNWFCCGIVALFSVLLWIPSVHYDFVWDDAVYISENKSLHSLANIPKFFTDRETMSSIPPYVSYRPLRNTVYALLFALDGGRQMEPAIFHLANVLCHAAVSALLFLVMLLLLERAAGISTMTRVASLLVALGFAAQPVTSEVVCWAKSLDDLMAAIFTLASARALLKWNESGRGYIASVVWFLIAVFSKESSVPFAAMAFLILYGFHKLPLKKAVKFTIPFFGVAFIFALAQKLVIGRTSQCPPLSGSYGQTLIDMFTVVVPYLRLLLGIPPFCADYNYLVAEPIHPFWSEQVWEGLVLLILFAALAIGLWRNPKWRLTSFGLIWFAVFMLPVSNLIPMMQYMAERFLYLPLMGFLIALCGVALNFPDYRRIAAFGAGALAAAWTLASLDRMPAWRDEMTLYLTTIAQRPGIARVEKNAVVAIFNLPEMSAWRWAKTITPAQGKKLIATLNAARRILPENDLLTAQLGLLEMRIGHVREGIWHLELGTRQNPESAERWYDLASAYRLNGQIDKAHEAVERAVKLDPKYKEARDLKIKIDHEYKPPAK